MLDEKARRLFAAIHNTSGGKYKIFEEEELLKIFDEHEGVNANAVKEMVLRLEAHRFLDVRYAEEGEYCLCSLNAGVRYLEELSEEKRAEARRRVTGVSLVFFASLLGGFAGSLIACLIFL